MLGVQRLGGALVVGGVHDGVPPEVAPLLHRAVGARVLDDDDRLQVSRSPISSSTAALIGAVLPLRRAPSTVISALASENSIRSRTDSAEKPPKTTLCDGADARAGEHRHRDLGDHRQEDPDDVARADPAVLQRVGEPLDVAVQVGVRDVALLALLAAPVERHAIAVAGLDVAVDAVVGDVELAADEPLGERRVRPVEHLVPRSCQCSASACSAQNPSGSPSASS